MENIEYAKAVAEKLEAEPKPQLLIDMLKHSLNSKSADEYFTTFLKLITIDKTSMVKAKILSDGIYYLQEDRIYFSRTQMNYANFCGFIGLSHEINKPLMTNKKRKTEGFDKADIYLTLKNAGIFFNKQPTEKALNDRGFIGTLYKYDGVITQSVLWDIGYLANELAKHSTNEKLQAAAKTVLRYLESRQRP